MFNTENRTKTGRKNLIGGNMRKLRKNLGVSQRIIADKLCESGLLVDKNAVQRMESGQRFISDIEIPYIAKIFGVSIPDLYEFGPNIPDDFKMKHTGN